MVTIFTNATVTSVFSQLRFGAILNIQNTFTVLLSNIVNGIYN